MRMQTRTGVQWRREDLQAELFGATAVRGENIVSMKCGRCKRQTGVDLEESAIQ